MTIETAPGGDLQGTPGRGRHGSIRRRSLTAGLLIVMGVLLGWADSAQAAGSITEYNEGLAGSSPEHIVEGPEGNLWFTASKGGVESSTPAIGRITPSGTVTTFSTGLTSGSSPFDITVGPDGNLWFTDKPVYGRGTPAIGRITPSGTITEFTEAHDENGDSIELSEPLNIIPGPDGNLWFTDWAYVGGEPAIGRITPSGAITEFKLPQFSLPRSIVVGPDRNLWFTDSSAVSLSTGSIGRITPGGTLTEFSTGLQSGGKPMDITVGSDGNLWFTESSNSSQGPAGIGRITPSGTITDFTAGLQVESHPENIVLGAEGNLWFTDRGGFGHVEGEHPLTGQIGRVTPSGTITEYGHNLMPSSIRVGPDGNIWVTDFNHRLDRVAPAGQLSFFWLGLIEDSVPGDLIAGPGGEGVWFTDSGFNEDHDSTGAIGKVAPVGSSGTSPLPTVEVQPPEAGSGIVTSVPAGISCPGVCSGHFEAGTAVALTATAAPGWYAISPSLDLQGDNPCPLVLPPVSLPSATCRFTVNGDALYRPSFEALGEPEEPSGGSGSPSAGGAAASAPSTPAATAPSAPPAPAKPHPKHKKHHKRLKCRKGFKKHKVHGKARCVRVKHRRAGRHQQRRRTTAPGNRTSGKEDRGS